MRKATVIEGITLFFVALFLYTGISKIMDYYIFREQIALSPLLKPIARWVAIILPVSEIIVSILLFIPKTRLKALYAFTIMMVMFTGYIIYILNFNKHLPCTCGGVLQSLSWGQHLVLNISLVLLSLIVIVSQKKTRQLKLI